MMGRRSSRMSRRPAAKRFPPAARATLDPPPPSLQSAPHPVAGRGRGHAKRERVGHGRRVASVATPAPDPKRPVCGGLAETGASGRPEARERPARTCGGMTREPVEWRTPGRRVRPAGRGRWRAVGARRDDPRPGEAKARAPSRRRRGVSRDGPGGGTPTPESARGEAAPQGRGPRRAATPDGERGPRPEARRAYVVPVAGVPWARRQSRRGLPPETVPQSEGVRLGGSGGRPAGKRDRRSPRAAHPPLQRGLGGSVEAAERARSRRAPKTRVHTSQYRGTLHRQTHPNREVAHDSKSN